MKSFLTILVGTILVAYLLKNRGSGPHYETDKDHSVLEVPLEPEIKVPEIKPLPDYYLIQRTTIDIPSGIASIKPGTKVSVENYVDSENVAVRTEKFAFVVPIENISNDPAIVSAVQMEEYKASVRQQQAMEARKLEMAKWELEKRRAIEETKREFIPASPEFATRYSNVPVISNVSAQKQTKSRVQDRASNGDILKNSTSQDRKNFEQRRALAAQKAALSASIASMEQEASNLVRYANTDHQAKRLYDAKRRQIEATQNQLRTLNR